MQNGILRIIYLQKFWAKVLSFCMDEMKIDGGCKKICFQNCANVQVKLNLFYRIPGKLFLYHSSKTSPSDIREINSSFHCCTHHVV